MNDKTGKYQYIYSNVNPTSNNVKTKYLSSGINNNKKTIYNTKNYLTRTEITQKSKNIIPNNIIIDLSKYTNNSQKEKNKDVILNKKTVDNNFILNNKNINKSIINESKSRYVNRSERRFNENNNNKVSYKKIYIDLNKEKKTNNYSSNNKKIQSENKNYQIKDNYDVNNNSLHLTNKNKNNFVVESSSMDTRKNPSKINTYSSKSKNIIFNNRLNNNKAQERKNIFKNNINVGGELKKIENIYLNIHNNNVIKNNNNILIKPNDINYNNTIENNKGTKQEKEIKNHPTNFSFENLNIQNIEEKDENYSDDDIQDNFCYDKNSLKEKENEYTSINKEYLQKYIDDNKKKEENSFPEDTDKITNLDNNNININYNDLLKQEETNVNTNKLSNLNNTINNDKINLENKSQNQIEFHDDYFNLKINNNRNQNNNLEINIGDNTNTKSSINNTNKFREYNNYYGNNNTRDTRNESINAITNIKNEKEFNNLIPKNAFRKFLTSKIKYYMKDDSIPKKFISDYISPNLKSKKNHKQNNSDFYNKKEQDLNYDFNTFNAYYENKTIINEINRNKSKNKKKIKNLILIDENQALIDRINQLKEYIDTSKTEMQERDHQIKAYLQTYDRINTENEQNKKRIENLEHELNVKNYEVEEKKNEINELNNINYNLEKEMERLKQEYINETINNQETKENYVIIKNNYNDIKNQYDLLNIKYQTLSDENYNFKRDKLLYEKELKTKNIIIDDLIQGNNSKKKELKGQLNKLELNKIEEKEIKNYLSSNKKERKEKEEIIKEKNNIQEKNQKQKYFEELNIDELMNLRDDLIGERNFINNEFYKIPTKANMKQNQRKEELEQRIAQINNELAKIRIRINILKEAKKIKKL